MQYEDKRASTGNRVDEPEQEVNVETVDLRKAGIDRFLRYAISICPDSEKVEFESMVRSWLLSLPPANLNEFYLKVRTKLERELLEIARGLYQMFKVNEARKAAHGG